MLNVEFTGGLAIGVPGEIKGLYEAWKVGGKLSWKDLFQATIKRLRDGFQVNETLTFAIEQQTTVLMRHDSHRQVQDADIFIYLPHSIRYHSTY